MKYYYYSKEKNLKGPLNFRMVKDRLYESLKECIENAKVCEGVDNKNPVGYVYTLQQVQSKGKNINNGYKSAMPLTVTACISVKSVYTE